MQHLLQECLIVMASFQMLLTVLLYLFTGRSIRFTYLFGHTMITTYLRFCMSLSSQGIDVLVLQWQRWRDEKQMVFAYVALVPLPIVICGLVHAWH